VTSPQPDPARPGIEASVDPGDTPPAADSMSGAAPQQQPNVGPVSGNRTPMVVTLVILGVIVVMVALLVGFSFVAS
jgi:hypothetical protein